MTLHYPLVWKPDVPWCELIGPWVVCERCGKRWWNRKASTLLWPCLCPSCGNGTAFYVPREDDPNLTGFALRAVR